MAVQDMVDWKGKPINKDKHGGIRAARFIYFTVMMTNITYLSFSNNMVTYLRGTMHLDVASASNTATNFSGGSCAFSLVGGFISDSYIKRFWTIIIFGHFAILGYGLLALQAHFPSLHPPTCDISTQFSNCKQVHGHNAALLYTALCITAFGEGCLKANLAPLGGDQFDDNNPTELRQKSSYFNWFTFNFSLGGIIGLTLMVWIEDNKGWDIGLIVSAGIVLLGMFGVASGFLFFRHRTPTSSPITRMSQVLVAAFRKRKLQLLNDEEMYLEYNKEGMVGEVLTHTKGFSMVSYIPSLASLTIVCRWLDKASIFDGKTGNWYLCSVSQVEEMKIVLRMFPIFITAMIGFIPIPQLRTFTIQQGGTMDTKLGKIHVPPASFMVISIILQLAILVFYDRFFVPFARRITGCPTGITHLQRIGVGVIAASLATATGAVIERKRKDVAEEHGLLDAGNKVPMSVMWLSLQLFGISINDVFAFIGSLEFFHTEVSKGMKSLGTAIFWCHIGLAAFMGSILVDVVNKVTRQGGIGWLEGNNLNRNHLDRFYWLLTILGLLGFFTYLFWARRYSYRQHNLAPIVEIN